MSWSFLRLAGVWLILWFWPLLGQASTTPLPAVSSLKCDLSFPQAAFPNVNTIYIPFTLVGQLIMVQARVDTMEGYFMMDTGSERLVLNSRYFSEEGRPVAAVGNTGWVSDVTSRKIDSLHVDQLVIRDLLAHLTNLEHIELKKNVRLIGILGYDVYKDFEVFLDFQNKVIVLRRVDRKGVHLDSIAIFETPYDSIDFDLDKHLIVLDTRVNGIKVRMIMDSGAELNLIDRKVNRRVLDSFDIIKRVNLLGVGKREVEVLAGVLKDVQCGNQYSPRMNTLLTSLDDINAAFDIHVQGVLGYEFIKRRRIMINYQKRKLYFFHPIRS